MRTPDGKCDDMRCPCRTELGYCALSACMNPNSSSTTTYVNPNNIPTEFTTTTYPAKTDSGYVDIGSMNIITDYSMKEYLRVYQQLHQLNLDL